MNAPLLIINGITGSGKTTALNYTQNWAHNGNRFHQVHPIAMLKRFLEDVYQCPNLDTQEGKAFIPPGSGSTMQDIMVGTWELFVRDGLDPKFSQRMMNRELASKPFDTPLVFNAIRNLSEVDYLFQLAEHRFMDIYFIRLIPPADDILKAPTSDENERYIAERLFSELPSHRIAQVNNPKILKVELQISLAKVFESFGFEHCAFRLTA